MARDIRGNDFLKSNWDLLGDSDQKKGVAMPDQTKPATGAVVPLPRPVFDRYRGTDTLDILFGRRSVRKYAAAPLSLDELGFLCFSVQGIQEKLPRATKRPPASGGARHPFETYLAVFDVEDLDPGLYRYLPFDHALEVIREEEPGKLREMGEAALLGQGWGAPVIFYWTAIPYRTQWRYEAASPKLIAVDAGHLMQNFYLASGVIGAGTCAIGAYDQELCDAFLGVDGESEMTVYAAPVGKKN